MRSETLKEEAIFSRWDNLTGYQSSVMRALKAASVVFRGKHMGEGRAKSPPFPDRGRI
jgi:hypothetical protein